MPRAFSNICNAAASRCAIWPWQTDNGSEFIGGHDEKGRPTGFPAELRGSQHLRIPPAAHTYQSNVETVHRLEEDEFFDLETLSSRDEFLAKTHTYQT